ncbi:MAG TPA: ATP-binding protein [Acetobacteraceae bacterium]|nr:ATP-binding protein [Acetobacteraceae bacterium]
MSTTDSGWPVGVLFLVAGVVLAALPVRLPGSAVSLLPAVLIPAWLTFGPVPTAVLAVAAVLLGNVFGGQALLPSILEAAMALAGVFVGDLATIAGPYIGTPPFGLPERTIIAALFAVGGWFGEFAIAKIAGRGDLVADVRALPRANLIANLLFVSPATILADVLATRGILLFVLLLVVLIVALALIALYLSAETDRRGAAGERERLQSIVSQVPDGILAVRSDLTVDWLNETAGRLTGWDPEEAAGRPILDIMQAQDTDGTIVDHRQSFLQAARTGQAVHMRANLRARDGAPHSVIISYTSMPSATNGLEIGVAAVREVPEDARDTQVMALGHELRSPLTAILGYTGLMMRAAPGSLDAEHQAEFIGRIAASSDYMLRLVNNLLDLRRMESGAEQLQPTLLQIDRVLQVVMALARLRASEKQLETSVSIEPGLPPLMTDELLLRRTVDNLLSNAIKYTPSGGTIRLSAAARNNGIEIAITDSGIGLTDEEQAKLFERFFRSNRPEARKERGTGLGLALVQESVRRLGGEVKVRSQVGVGSTFTVWIPPLDRVLDVDAAPSAASIE